MRKNFIQKIVLTMIFGWISVVAFAQTPPTSLAASRYFYWEYDSLTATEETAFTVSGATVKTAVDGDSLIFYGANSKDATRAKSTYTGAVKCKAFELPAYASLGYLSCYVQNGSGSATQDISAKVWDGTTWITVETLSVAANTAARFTPTAALSKKGVKVKIESAGTFWFYQVEAWSSTQASTNVNEAPVMLSSNPAAAQVIPSTGTINIQFDEIVKLGTGSITFGSATVTPTFLGNTLQLSYSGLTGSSNTLIVPASFVQNTSNISLATGISIAYTGDIVDPVYLSASPVDGSSIVINDVLQKIILTFDENIAIGTGTITFGPATVTPTVSGKTLIIGYSGLAYSTPYTLTVPANMITDISGNTYKNAINLNYTTLGPDVTAPLLSSNAATNVPIGGSLYFTFNEDMELGTGNVTLDGSPVTISVNKSMVGINYTNLNYNTTHTVNIPAGALTDTTGNAYAGTSFTFTTQAQVFKNFDIIVASDGSGDYLTINAAIAAVPDNSSQRTFIFVKSGTYNEKVSIAATKQNVSLIGQDSSNTIITYNDNAGNAGSTDLSYTIDIKAPGFYAENFKIKNTWSTTGGTTNQAVALMTEGDRQVFKNCRLYSFQDTHYPKVASTRNYYLNCYIEGATDFMFGGATAYFEGCTINCVNGGQYITAPSTTTREFGLVYNNCTITANSDVQANTFYLGRPWKDFAKTVWLNTRMGAHVKDIGWSVWTSSGPDADNNLTGFFAEYNSMNLLGASINPIRATWGVKLTTAQAARYNIDNVFNYGVGLNTWNPLPFSTAPSAPANLVNTGGVLTWNATPFAVAYIVFRNGVECATVANNTFTATVLGNYSVKAVNEFGAQSPASTGVVAAINIGNLSKIGVQLYPNPFTEVITIQNSEKVNELEFYNEEGRLVKQAASAPTIKTSDMEAGTYILKLTDFNGNVYSQKMIKR